MVGGVGCGGCEVWVGCGRWGMWLRKGVVYCEEDVMVCGSSSAEVDMDVDEFEVGQVDKLNVMALEYGVPAGLFSK